MKPMQHITALKARRNLGQILEEVYYRGSRYVIERAGRPLGISCVGHEAACRYALLERLRPAAPACI